MCSCACYEQVQVKKNGRDDAPRWLIANVHTIDGSGPHALKGTGQQRVSFKKSCLQAVLEQLLEAQRHVAGMKDHWGDVDIMCCGDFNLTCAQAVQAVQDMGHGGSRSLVVQGGRGSLSRASASMSMCNRAHISCTMRFPAGRLL